MRDFMFHLMEWPFVISAMYELNERDAGMNRWKTAVVLIVFYVSSVITNLLPRFAGEAVGQYPRLLTMAITILGCCILFTGGIPKIMLSVFIADVWMGINEILMVILFCLICGKDLNQMYLYQYEEYPVLQWMLEIGTGFTMLQVWKPVFHRYRRMKVSDGKPYVFLSICVLLCMSMFQIKPLGLMREDGFPYYYTLIYGTAFLVAVVLVLCYNRKCRVEGEIQELYLKQKLEEEYAMLFADMDKEMRCFRHDLKKHMDALEYLAGSGEIHIPKDMLEKYQNDLKAVYERVTYGNYCCKYDVNLILTQTADVCKRNYAGFSAALRNLDLDSLPLNLRVQLFQLLKQWMEEQRIEEGSWFTMDGMSTAGFHTLKVSLKKGKKEFRGREKLRGRVKFQEKFRRLLYSGKMTVEIRKLLHGYHAAVKTKQVDGEIFLTVSWYGG